jgi:hypothetical protein
MLLISKRPPKATPALFTKVSIAADLPNHFRSPQIWRSQNITNPRIVKQFFRKCERKMLNDRHINNYAATITAITCEDLDSTRAQGG